MSGAGFLRVKKLKGAGIVKKAAGHNKRSIPCDEKIDPTRSHLNYALAGPANATDVAQLAKDTMTAAGVTKLRKDAVMALEIVFSLHAGHGLDERAYFTDCAEWAARYYGGVVLSVDVHLDEAAPHCHLLMMPLLDGRMAGSDMLGGKQMLMAMHKQFHLDVASRYGLSKAPPKLTGAAKEAAVKAVLQKMRETGDAALQSAAWAVIRDSIESDPAPFLVAYGIELQAPIKKLRTMAQIFTSKGKGGIKESNPIGFTPPEKERTLCSVWFTPKAPPQPTTPKLAPGHHCDDVGQPLSDVPNADGEVAAPTRPAPAAAPTPLPALNQLAAPPPLTRVFGPAPLPTNTANTPAQPEAPFVEQITRHRDCDQATDRYDSVTGDFIPTKPLAPRLNRQAADGWVTSALAARPAYGHRALQPA